MLYKYQKARRSSIKANASYEGERIEEKVHRIVNNKEPIKDGAPLIYTDRKDGVKPEYDIRADRFEIAVEAMDKVAQTRLTERKKKFEESLDKSNKSENKEVGGEKTDSKVAENKADQGTGEKPNGSQ